MKPNDLPLSSATATAPASHEADASPLPTSPKSKKRVRAGWRATIVRQDSFRRLRDIQKSMVDPALDLSYLSDACLRIALDQGAEAIVRCALSDLNPQFRQP